MRSTRLLVAAVLTALLGSILVVASPTPARAGDDVPAVVEEAADDLRCRLRRAMSYAGPENEGLDCRVKRRGDFSVRKYDNPRRAVRWWRHYWLDGSPDAYFVRRGALFIIPEDYDGARARWAARRVDGRVLHGSHG